MSVTITRDDIIAYAEVDYIIHHMNEKYINKLPESLVYFFDEIKDPEHKVSIDPYKPLQSQGLKKYTLEIVALLHLKYWCEDENRKKELYDLMLRNQQKIEEQMKEKFSIDKLFDNNSVKVVKEEFDLEDYSKPKKIQKVGFVNNDETENYQDINADIVQENEFNNEEKFLKEIENQNEIKDVIDKIKKFILRVFHKGA